MNLSPRQIAALFLLAGVARGLAAPLSDQKPPPAARAMALLKANCFSCHNYENKKGGLRLTSRDQMLKGGDDGPVVLPGNAGKSLLLQALQPEADPHMPPKRQLSSDQINALRAWIDAGAPWDAQALAAESVPTALSQLGPMPPSYHPALALALTSDGQHLAAGRGSLICLYDFGQTNKPLVANWEAHRDAVQSLAWDPDGRRLASGGFKQLVVWDAATGRPIAELTNGLSGRLTALEFSRDGKFIVAADGETAKSGLIQFWKPGDARPEATVQAHQDTIFAIALSRDGKLLATAGADKLVKLWSVEDRRQLSQFEGHTGHVLALAFNSDGSWLASGGTDKEVKIWEIKSRDKIIAINKQSSPVAAMSWTPDGKKLVAACDDGSLRIFSGFKAHSGAESSDGADMRKLDDAEGTVYCAVASTDAKAVYAGNDAGTIYGWNDAGKLTKLPSPEAGLNFGKPAEKTAAAK